MTPAQKIARQVRISFSLSQPPALPSPTHPTSPIKTTQHHESDLKSIPSPPETLTPAQVVAQQARQMDSHTDPQPKPPLPKSHETHPPTSTSTAVNSSPQDSVSFRVISGRKGLPGDGQDKMAVVRSPPENSHVRFPAFPSTRVAETEPQNLFFFSCSSSLHTKSC